ncbi:hypothetical protein [Pacificoceanicola onchidii]|nr:hypothetical protein [Pacificoceanicola onchidii]
MSERVTPPQGQSAAARAALEALEQAWAYFTPETRKEADTPVYEDIPLAA